MKAKYAGNCPYCNTAIAPGDELAKGSKGWGHGACAASSPALFSITLAARVGGVEIVRMSPPDKPGPAFLLFDADSGDVIEWPRPRYRSTTARRLYWLEAISSALGWAGLYCDENRDFAVAMLRQNKALPLGMLPKQDFD